MAKYTLNVFELVNAGFDFGLDEYPIFDEEYRPVLNKVIIDHFYMYEIGFETPMLFRHYLKSQMDLIMPKYNAMFKAQLQMLENPLGNVDLTETLQRNVNGSGTSESNNNANSKNLFQDTPQGEITQTAIDEQQWATNLNLNKSNVNGNTESHTNTAENYTKRIVGNNGRRYNAEIYEKLTKGFVSVNMLIVNDLENLFMGVL